MFTSGKPIRAELEAYATWEAALGEPIVLRAAGRFLAVHGVDAPERMWGLIVLTPTRLIFRHFSQPHPLFGGRDEEVLWEGQRSEWTCTIRSQKWWAKLFTGLPDHCVVSGPNLEVAVETVARARDFVAAWNSSASSSTATHEKPYCPA